MSKGFGGYYTGKWFSSAWSEDLPLVSDKTLSIAFLELYPIVISAILWGKEWKCKNILFWCDNEHQVNCLISFIITKHLDRPFFYNSHGSLIITPKQNVFTFPVFAPQDSRNNYRI
jgi:hypothetical protein